MPRASANGMHLSDVFGCRHKVRHRPKRFAFVVHIQSGDYYSYSSVSQIIAHIYYLIVKKLSFIYAYYIAAIGKEQNTSRSLYRCRRNFSSIVRYDVSIIITCVKRGFEYFYFLLSKLSAAQSAYKFFSFA